MIDHFLSAEYEREVRAGQNRDLVDALKRLPNEDLYKLASGQVKLAYGDGDVDDWLQKYKGTPLFERAVSLERSKLELDATEQAQRQEREEVMKGLRDDTIGDERDRLCLEKRVLDLELATAQAGGAGPDELEAQEGAGLEMAQQAHETEMAQQGKPPIPAAPGAPQAGGGDGQAPKEEKPKPKGMTVSVKQEAEEEPKPPAAEKQAGYPGVLKTLSGSAARVAEEGAHKFPHPKLIAEANKFRGATQDARALVGGTLGATALLRHGHEDKAGMEQKIAGVDAIARSMARQDAKLAFAVTEKGHKFDAERYRMLSRHQAEKAQQGQEYGALGYRTPEGKREYGNVLNALRFSPGLERPEEKARHYEYAAKKHEQGSNAWNPFGGTMTPSQHEEGGTAGTFVSSYGKAVPKTAGIADMGMKALGAVKPFAQTLGAGAKEVGQAFASGGAKAGLGALKNVGGIVAQSHPLGTAALAGGAGMAAGSMLGHNRSPQR